MAANDDDLYEFDAPNYFDFIGDEDREVDESYFGKISAVFLYFLFFLKTLFKLQTPIQTLEHRCKEGTYSCSILL